MEATSLFDNASNDLIYNSKKPTIDYLVYLIYYLLRIYTNMNCENAVVMWSYHSVILIFSRRRL